MITHQEQFRMAIKEGNLEKIHELVKKGPVDINDQDFKAGVPTANTPLFLAANFGHVEIVRFLLAQPDINLELKNERGSTALHIAAQEGKKEVCGLLLDHGARVNCRNRVSVTPLWAAAFKGEAEVIELLLKRNADPDIPEKNGITPLWIAIQNGQLKVVRKLLDGGADPEIANSDEVTPLMIARTLRNREAEQCISSFIASQVLVSNDKLLSTERTYNKKLETCKHQIKDIQRKNEDLLNRIKDTEARIQILKSTNNEEKLQDTERSNQKLDGECAILASTLRKQEKVKQTLFSRKTALTEQVAEKKQVIRELEEEASFFPR